MMKHIRILRHAAALTLCSAVICGAAETAGLVFDRVQEPRENAFSMIVPHGWTVDGGISRLDPTAMGGAAQSIEAKLDMTIKKDERGTVMARVLSDMRYADVPRSNSPAAGMFPYGSNYNGMLVAPCPNAQGFITQMAFPYLHPGAQELQVKETHPAADLAQKYQQSLAALPLPFTPVCDAGVVILEYTEDGVAYREVWSAVIVNWGPDAMGMWENKETRFARTPAAEFTQWIPVFAAMQASIQINPKWLAGEIQGQMTRSQIVLDTQRDIARIEQEMTENRRKVNSEIQNSMYLTLTGQEDYKNPFTGEYETRPVELGKYRWVNDLGQEVYSDNNTYDPNADVNLYHKGFQRCAPRP
ncbi:MAG: hypothetical protein PHI18_06830 [bacterium]|nr:hypothetical protein [bacterium]